MKSFAERNLVVIAITGLIALFVIAYGTFFSANLPVIGAGPTYHANFSEAAGLKSGDDVLVAGVKVGTVSGVSLQGTHVHVSFRVKSAWMGDRSRVSIKIKTLLGQKYLAVFPLGTNKLKHGATIPLDRTTSPYDVTTAFSQLSNTFEAINTDTLAKSFQTLSDAFAQTPPEVRATLDGLSALSQTIASRDDQISQLLANAKDVTGTIAGSDAQIKLLIDDGDKLVSVLNARSAQITALLQGTVSLSAQLTGLVNDNTATLKPALTRLTTVTTLLQNNQANLQKAFSLLGPYYTLLDDAIGNGRWLDTYACGLFNAQDNPELHPTATRTCSPTAGS